MKRISLVVAGIAVMFGSAAQASGPLLPRLQSGLKQLPALTAPVVATARGLTSIKALPALSAPVLSAALPGLSTIEAKAYYYPPYDPGSGSDWLSYNQTVWLGQISPFTFHAVGVAQELATELGGRTLEITEVLSDVGNLMPYATGMMSFGLDRAAGLVIKIGPPPLPKRPEELSGLDPTIGLVSDLVFGGGSSPAAH